MINNIDELKIKALGFYKSNTLVFVKRFNSYNEPEYINGYISESPSADFFLMSDIKEPDKAPKLVFFIELLKPETLFIQSRKEDVK